MRTPSADIAMVVSGEFDTTTAELTRAMMIMEVYSGGPISSELSDRNGASVAMTTTPTHPAKNEPIAEMNSETPSRPALLRHRMAVETYHDGRGFARHVQHDRRGRTGVMRPVIDPGQHDQRS